MAAIRKVVFVAFAIEDERARDFLKGQALNTKCPFDYVDMSVKDAYAVDWKAKVQTRIRRSDGVIALISKSSLNSAGQKWEIQCARENNVPIIGVWAYSDDRTVIPGLKVIPWTWDGIKNFIDSL